MGLLVEGTWRDEGYDTKRTAGRFERAASTLRNWVTADGGPGPTGQPRQSDLLPGEAGGAALHGGRGRIEVDAGQQRAVMRLIGALADHGEVCALLDQGREQLVDVAADPTPIGGDGGGIDGHAKGGGQEGLRCLRRRERCWVGPSETTRAAPRWRC